MRFLICSDPHAHNYREFATLDGAQNSRFTDCLDALDLIRQDVETEKADEVIITGDLFHLKNSVDSAVIRRVMEMLCDFPRPVNLVFGNHDYVRWNKDPELLYMIGALNKNVKHYMGGWAVRAEDNDPRLDSDFNIYVAHYNRKVSELVEQIEKLEVPKRTIFLGHQDLIGSEYGAIINKNGIDPDLLSKKFWYSFVGHYHTSQQVRDNVISVGAPLQHSFSDIDSKRGWWIFDTDTEELTFKENTFSPQFKELIVEKGAGVDISDSHNFYRIKVKGSNAPKGIDNIRFKRISYEDVGAGKRRSTLSLSDKKEDIIEKYVKLKGGDLDASKLIELGRGYL